MHQVPSASPTSLRCGTQVWLRHIRVGGCSRACLRPRAYHRPARGAHSMRQVRGYFGRGCTGRILEAPGGCRAACATLEGWRGSISLACIFLQHVLFLHAGCKSILATPGGLGLLRGGHVLLIGVTEQCFLSTMLSFTTPNCGWMLWPGRCLRARPAAACVSASASLLHS